MVGTLPRKLALHLLRTMQRSYPPGTLPGNFLKILQAVRNNYQDGGIKQVSQFFLKSAARLLDGQQGNHYQCWLWDNEPTAAELADQRRLASLQSHDRPGVSFVITLAGTSQELLAETIGSIREQTSPDWQLCFALPRNVPATTRRMVVDLAEKDKRVACIDVPARLGAVEQANLGLDLAHGKFIALLEPGDRLAPFAIHEVTKFLNDFPDCDIVYADEDQYSSRGRIRPIFKPDWSPEMLLGHNYLGNGTIIRRDLAKEMGGFRPECAGAHDWDLLLRISERSQRIKRLPKILYHRRAAAGRAKKKEESADGRRRALGDHLKRRGMHADVCVTPAGTCRLAGSSKNPPLVSIIIPSRNAARLIKNCLRGLLEATDYSHREIIVVDNESDDREVLAFYDELKTRGQVKIAPFNQPFNYSAACNEGARHANGQLLLFLNNDIEVIEPGWLQEMARWAIEPHIGVVGAKLLYANKRIQHAGVVLHGKAGDCGHVFRSLPEGTQTLFGSPDGYRNYLAVTGACQMMRSDVFRAVGGYDENYRLCCSDVVLCLAAWQKGYRNVYTPHARLFHLECSTRGFSDPKEALDRERFSRLVESLGLTADPYFHPALKLVLSQPELS